MKKSLIKTFCPNCQKECSTIKDKYNLCSECQQLLNRSISEDIFNVI